MKRKPTDNDSKGCGRLLTRLLRKNTSPARVAGFLVSNFLGLAIVLGALQFYSDANSIWSADDSFVKSDWLVINKKVKDGRTTTLMRYDSDSEQWIEAAELPYRYEGNRLEVIVPRKLLGLTGDGFTFDFKWSDNAYELEDPISLCLHGDTAPNRRFNYRCIWNRR